MSDDRPTMRLHSIRLDGFRGHDCTVDLPGVLSVLVGANNSGKSNVIDALRTVLSPADGPRARRWITAADFAHGLDGGIEREDFMIEVVLSDLDDEQQAAMVTCLSPSLGEGFARLRLYASLRPTGAVDTTFRGGDSEAADVDRFAREAVQFVYLPPLRDAIRELRPGPGNRVASLMRTRVPKGHADRDAMETIVQDANAALDGISSMVEAETAIDEHLHAMSGARFAQDSDLRFAPAEFEAIVRQLSAHAGAISTLELDRNGLGSNNLLFMGTLLSALNGTSDALLTVLLVEEPEAHLHPQLQDLLLRFLEDPGAALTRERERRTEGQGGAPSDEGGRSRSVHSVVTSHSPNVAAAAGVDRVAVLTRPVNQPAVARSPHVFGMNDRDLAHLGRYLDVTKAALLFARGVILVEGVAEQLVVPALAHQMGMPLHDHGVTVVNVDGLAFGPFLELFAPERLPHRCAVITDGDIDDGGEGGTDPALSASTRSLIARVEGWPNAAVFHNADTFEDELVRHGEWDVLLDALAAVHGRVAATLRKQGAEWGTETRATEFLAAIERNRAKGRFAQALAAELGNGKELEPPPYIKDAITFACGWDA